MVKGSLNVKVTNSERTNKLPELERGVAITELLDTELGGDLESRFPAFDVVRDPAYLTVDLGDGESGFETVLRENPFRGNAAANATPVVGLCQDHLDDGSSRLATLVEGIADHEDGPLRRSQKTGSDSISNCRFDRCCGCISNAGWASRPTSKTAC
jgi:siderophore synthetase component